MPTNTKTVINWFEIPTAKLDRAAVFYAKVLQTELKHERFNDTPHAIFMAADPMTAGALVEAPHLQSGATGTRIYLHAVDGVAPTLRRVVEHGGKVILGETSIGPQGFIGVFEDLDGNHIGLHTEA